MELCFFKKRPFPVDHTVSAMNSDKVLCGVAGIYPSYVAGILNQVNEINFYVLCNEQLKYSDFIEKCTSGRQCTISFMSVQGNYYKLSSSSGEFIVITFETRNIEGELPSVLTFAYDVLNNIRLSSLAYVIVCINKRVNYITNHVLTCRHDCVLDQRISYLNVPKSLANCKVDTSSSVHPYRKFPWYSLYCTKKSHHWYGLPLCACKLCVKDGPATLKSLCVNTLGKMLPRDISLNLMFHEDGMKMMDSNYSVPTVLITSI
jgi:hypothetical protein